MKVLSVEELISRILENRKKMIDSMEEEELSPEFLEWAIGDTPESYGQPLCDILKDCDQLIALFKK